MHVFTNYYCLPFFRFSGALVLRASSVMFSPTVSDGFFAFLLFFFSFPGAFENFFLPPCLGDSDLLFSYRVFILF